jgi:hypothetical protein
MNERDAIHWLKMLVPDDADGWCMNCSQCVLEVEAKDCHGNTQYVCPICKTETWNCLYGLMYELKAILHQVEECDDASPSEPS